MDRRACLVALLSVCLPVGGLLVAAPASAVSPATVALGDTAVYEGNSGFTTAHVAVTLSDSQSSDLFVSYTTIDGDATGGSKTSGADYVSRHGRVKFRAGKTSAAIAVKVTGEVAFEEDQDFGITITAISLAGVIAADDTATITIRNDDSIVGGAPPSIAIGDATVYEGDSGFVTARVAVTLSESQPADLFVSYTTVDGDATGGSKTSGADYVSRHGRVKFKAGKVAAVVAVKVAGDTGYESDQTFDISLTSVTPAGVPVADDTSTITIRNDDASPLPGVPTGLAAVPGPSSRYLTASWSAPLGSATVDGYDLEVARGATINVLSNVASPNSFGCGLASVTDTCTLRVRAFNAAGAGPWSTPISAATWAPPEAPPNITSTGTTIFWDVPNSDRPILNYWVFRSPDGGNTWTQVTTTMNLHASAGCAICLVRVQAQSEVGFGAFATIELAWAPPSAPTALVVTRDTANPALLHISWSAPLLATPPIDSYTLTVNDFTAPLTIPDITATAMDVRMRNAGMVSVTVFALNAAGLGPVASVLVPAG